jgi:hypothetical protein
MPGEDNVALKPFIIRAFVESARDDIIANIADILFEQ